MRLLLPFILLCFTGMIQAQNRVSESNQIGWLSTMGTIQLSQKFAFQPEVQWRRTNWITSPQQDLYRFGFQYAAHPAVWFRAGYAYIETYHYGTFPLNSMGKNFSEHRIQVAVLLNSRFADRLDMQQRIMGEYRWVGAYSNPTLQVEDKWNQMYRLRYQLRMQLPLQGPTLDPKEWYIATWNELFVGLGKNVNKNTWDQNRFAALLGYRIHPNLRIEGGFFSQIVQLGREDALGRNIFQYNNGYTLQTFWNLDLRRKKTNG